MGKAKRSGIGILRAPGLALLLPASKVPKSARAQEEMIARFSAQQEQALALENLSGGLFSVVYLPGDHHYSAGPNLDNEAAGAVDLIITGQGCGTPVTRMAKEMRRVARWYQAQAAALEKAARGGRDHD